MKKITFILLLFIAGGIYGQNLTTTEKLSKVFEKKLDTKTNPNLSLRIIQQDSTIKALKDTITAKNVIIKTVPQKPETGSKPIAWIDYFIALGAFIILWFLSKLKYLQTINVPIIQRFVSETSSFINKIQQICVVFSVIIPIIIGLGVFSGYVLSIFGNFEIIFLSIAGFTLFTTKRPDLQK